MVSVRRVVPVLLLIAALPSLGAKTPSTKSTHPPRELHRVGEHSTPYFPPDPATYPAGSKTYEIKRGDTLWALANQFYGNPDLWPQLWESNTWITDAHWIYPGDVLLVEGEVSQKAAAGATAGAATTTGGSSSTNLGGGIGSAQPTTGGSTATAKAGNAPAAPVALGTEADVYCYGFLGPLSENLPNTVDSFEDVEMRYQPGAAVQSMGGSVGDMIYVDGGTATGLSVGDTYLVVEPQELVEHPVTHAVVGRHWNFKGQIKILRADEHRSAAEITQSCEDIHVGDKLRPLPQIPIPLAHIPPLPPFYDPIIRKNSGYIVHAQDGREGALGEGTLVEVNVGHDDNVNPGDFLLVWRPSLNPTQPPQVLGEIGILTSESHTATGKIVDMRYSMQVGDHVELR